MRKMVVVAVREYLAAVRTKAFVISLVIMPVMMGGSIVVQWLLRDYRDIETKKFAVIDRTTGERLLEPIRQIVEEYNRTQINDPQTKKQVQPRFLVEAEAPSADTPEAIAEQRADLSERVRKGELFGFLEIGSDVLQPTSPADSLKESHAIRYQSNRPTKRKFPPADARKAASGHSGPSLRRGAFAGVA